MVRPTRLSALSQNAPLAERVDALEDEAMKLGLLLEMSQVLSSEKELDAVMKIIVDHTTQIMHCERSSFFMLDKAKSELYALLAQGIDVKELRFSIKNGIAGHVASNGVGLNIPDAYKDPRFNQAVDKATGFRTVSILCMPLRDRRGEVLGVIQCLNKTGPRNEPAIFSAKDEIVLSAVAAQAAVFLDNMALRQQMDVLFDAFVDATSRSIDDRDPCTHGHSRRVTQYSLNLARAVHTSNRPPFDKVTYTRPRMRQLRYACLLHDVGKIGVREYILSKAQKLAPAAMRALRERFGRISEKSRADAFEKIIAGEPRAEVMLVHETLRSSIDQALIHIEAANIANFMTDAQAEALDKIHDTGLITPEEFINLRVRRGNLTDSEWEDMRSHVTKSFRMLVQIPWPVELKDLPEVAYTHHEKYDGSGYPRKLKNGEIHFDGHIMCVADIYDALTATDRPYKKAMTHERAHQILMEEEAKRGRILPELVELFFAANCYKISESSSSIFI